MRCDAIARAIGISRTENDCRPHPNLLSQSRHYHPRQRTESALPGVGLILLIFAPYIDKNPSNKPEDRKFAISIMTVHIMFWSVLVIIGSFFRGPGFNFTLPWRDGLFFDL